MFGSVARTTPLPKSRATTPNRLSTTSPWEDVTRGDIVGLLDAKNSTNAAKGDERALVRDHMCALSEADLIGADATIFDFICRARPKPLLVVAGGRIQGLVAWSDLQKLPVRAAVFALVTGFELTMYEAIKAVFPCGDGWQRLLSKERLRKAKDIYAERSGKNSDVELLLCTEFCDKRTILKKRLFDPKAMKPEAMPVFESTFESDVKGIEELRNLVAHASTYAMNWGEVEDLRKTVKTLVTLRKHIKRHSPS